MTGTAALGIDVGGTGVKARAVDADGRVVLACRVATPLPDPSADRLVSLVTELARAAAAAARERDAELAAVGVVVPGVVDDRSGTVVRAVNLGWADLPLRERLARGLSDAGVDLPLAFGQDVRAGALAEARTGAASNRTGTIAFVPIGTGLASAVVVSGSLVPGESWAGELGQVVLTTGQHAGRRIEEIASASAIARRAGAPDARTVAARLRAGDAAARVAWEEGVEVLADALAWLAAITGCEAVVLGGGLAEAGEALFAPLRPALAARLVGVRVPELLSAQHGDAAGVAGAVELARDLVWAGR